MSHQSQFEEAFTKAVNDRLLYIPEELWESYVINDFEGYMIYAEKFASWWIYAGHIRKWGKTVYTKEMWKALFRNIINKIEDNYRAHQEWYFATLLEDLEKKSTDTMSPVFKDVKRLREITAEATEIHKKYKKSFFNLFS